MGFHQPSDNFRLKSAIGQQFGVILMPLFVVLPSSRHAPPLTSRLCVRPRVFCDCFSSLLACFVADYTLTASTRIGSGLLRGRPRLRLA